MKCLGIIGGHGSNAAIELQYYINENINKCLDTRRYIKTITINDATVNSDRETINNLYKDTKINKLVEEDIFNSVKSLIKLGCDVITIPCNTYSNLLSKNKNIKNIKKIKDNNVEIVNIIDVTSNWVIDNFPNVKRIGLIGTSVTIDSRFYHDKLKDYEIICYKELEDDINSIILCVQYGYYKKNPSKRLLLKLGIKNTTSLVRRMNKIINKFKKNGIQHLILGCTELPLFVKYNISKLNKIKFIDTMEILAEHMIS